LSKKHDNLLPQKKNHALTGGTFPTFFPLKQKNHSFFTEKHPGKMKRASCLPTNYPKALNKN